MSLRWYSGIAPIYDWFCRPLYAGPRHKSVKLLQLEPGESVLDLCCGTGLNLPSLADALDGEGALVGVDFTPAMLDRARPRVERIRARYPNLHIRLDESDAAALGPDQWRALSDTDQMPDAILCSYGLAVAPNWQAIADQAWKLLRPGGRIVVVDNQPFQRAPLRWANPVVVPISNFLGQAELRRDLAQPFDDTPPSAELQSLGSYVFVRRYDKPVRAAP